MTNDTDKKLYEESVEMEIIQVLDRIRPFIQRDGGDLRLVKYEDGIVYVKLYGACAGCAFKDYTIEDNILEAIKEMVPEVKGVINVEI